MSLMNTSWKLWLWDINLNHLGSHIYVLDEEMYICILNSSWHLDSYDNLFYYHIHPYIPAFTYLSNDINMLLDN